jgi:hypothetical protein
MNKKHFFLLIFQIVLIFQSFAQSSAGIYSIRFYIDRRLVNPVQISSGGNNIQQSGLNRVRLSDANIDSIKAVVTRTVSAELNTNSECVYRKNKRGRDIKSYDGGNVVRGMPLSSKRQAIHEFDKDYYVHVRISYSIATGISLGNALLGSSRYRPIVYIVITAFNAEKKKVYSKTVSVRDFEKLQSFQYTVNGVTVRNAEVLQPQQIFEMLVKSLQELIARGKR